MGVKHDMCSRDGFMIIDAFVESISWMASIYHQYRCHPVCHYLLLKAVRVAGRSEHYCSGRGDGCGDSSRGE